MMHHETTGLFFLQLYKRISKVLLGDLVKVSLVGIKDKFKFLVPQVVAWRDSAISKFFVL